MTWYAFRTEPQREYASQEIVNRHGFKAVVPYEWRSIRRSRHIKRRDAKPYPKFVGYIFIEVTHPPNWYQMFSMHCLKSVVGFDGRPTPIPQAAIDRLLLQQGESMPHVLSRNTRRASVMPGDAVRVFEGPLKGYEGRVEEIRGAKARMFVEMLGARREIDVPIEALEAA